VDKVLREEPEAHGGPLGCRRAANLMEVCGTHSHAIAQYGIKQLLPQGVRLISGPGCPVCVTPVEIIDLALAIARLPQTTVTTFGDMVRVPGTDSTLSREKALGRDVRIVYSPMAAVETAVEEPDRQVVFIAVGFETTAPMVAACILEAERLGLSNFSIIAAHKIIPPAMRALLQSGEVRIDGFLCPGHVATVIGLTPFARIASEFGLPCVVSGFEPEDIIAGLRGLLRQIDDAEGRGENAYQRCVKDKGNPRALATTDQVFEATDANWRGLGQIPLSGLRLRWAYSRFDAERRFDVELPTPREHPGCSCGSVLRGLVQPAECPLFGAACTPTTPVGPCMVSSEGACAAAYRYEQ